jgi:hypothetical protein
MKMKENGIRKKNPDNDKYRERSTRRSCRTENSPFVSHRKLAVRVAPKSRSNDAAAAYQIAARR